MKFLCLHGMGTNSDIFETQIAPMCSRLQDQGHEFIFVDGLIECDAAPGGISSLFPGPYLCYYDLPTPDKVRAAHDYIHEIIKEEGPFDGVFGFSQGAALASSIILEHSKFNPVDDLFKFAVFIAASLPFDLDDETGMQHWELAVKKAVEGKEGLGGEFAGELKKDGNISISVIEDVDSESTTGSSDDEDNHTRGFPLRSWMLGTKVLLGRYHPERNLNARIKGPTLHILSERDQYAGQSESLVRLCGTDSLLVKHDDGHRVPRNKAFEMKAAAALDSLLRSALMRH